MTHAANILGDILWPKVTRASFYTALVNFSTDDSTKVQLVAVDLPGDGLAAPTRTRGSLDTQCIGVCDEVLPGPIS
jgi:hypothetical protein